VRARAGGANTTPYFLAAHFAKRNMKFGGGGKIGIGKRGRAKIPSPQPPARLATRSVAGRPSFSPARAFSFCRAKRGNQSGFCSKKVRAAFSNCDQFRHFENSEAFCCSLAPPEFIPHGDAGAGLASQKALYFGIKS